MSDEERMSKAMEVFRNYTPDFDNLKIWDNKGQVSTVKDMLKKLHRRPKPYEWYRRDLKRKRKHRKQGRNLYKGIQAYRQRVGQLVPSKKGLGFRGVAALYDHLRIRVIGDHPEMAERLPDLYTRYMSWRFPVADFYKSVLGTPTPQKPSRGIDLSRYGIADNAWIRLPADKSLFVTPSMVTAGADAISRADPHDDAVMGMAMAMLRDSE